MRHLPHTLAEIAVWLVSLAIRARDRLLGEPALAASCPQRPWEALVDSCPTLERIPVVEDREIAAYRSQTSSR